MGLCTLSVRLLVKGHVHQQAFHLCGPRSLHLLVDKDQLAQVVGIAGCVPLIQDRGDPSGLISLKDRGFLQGCIHKVRSRAHVCTDNRSDHHRGH
jgi:hypothetical protein